MRVSNNSKKVKREQKEAREDFMYGVLRLKTELQAYKEKFEEDTKISPTKMLVAQDLYEIYLPLSENGIVQGLELVLDSGLENGRLTFK